MNERLRDIFGRHFGSKEIAGHVVLFGDSSRLRPGPDHLVVQKTAANSISVYCVHPDLVAAMFQGVLPRQETKSHPSGYRTPQNLDRD